MPTLIGVHVGTVWLTVQHHKVVFTHYINQRNSRLTFF